MKVKHSHTQVSVNLTGVSEEEEEHIMENPV